MKTRLIPSLFVLLFFWGTSPLCHAAISDQQIKMLENKVHSLEKKQTMQSMVNPPGRPEVRDGADVFFKGDLLIWQSHEGGLSFATLGSSLEPTPSALYDTKTINLHFDWDVGFRFGIGYNTPHDGWDLFLGWTHFMNTASQKGYAPRNSLYLPSFPYALSTNGLKGFKEMGADWTLHLNLLNIELGREFFVSKWMTLRPLISLRAGWVRQKMEENFSSAISSTALSSLHLFNSCKFFGIGPRAGLNTEWSLKRGFSLFGDATFSILYGYTKVKNTQKQGYETKPQDTFVRNQNSVRLSQGIGELALGIRWDKMLQHELYHIRIQGGWEQLLFFSQNQFSRFIGSSENSAGALITNQGDLTIQGWTLSMRFDF